MNRRSFIALVSAVLAAIPFLRGRASAKEPGVIYNSHATPIDKDGWAVYHVQQWNPSMLPGCKSYFCVNCGVDEVPHVCTDPRSSFVVYDRVLNQQEAAQVRSHMMNKPLLVID